MKTILDRLAELTDTETILKLEIYGFNLAYEEASFLGLPKEGELFDKMVIMRQNAVIYNVYQMVEMATKKNIEFDIIIPQDEELPEIVRRYYEK